MMIAGFILSMLGLTMMIVGFIAPRYYDAFIPVSRRAEGTEATVANELKVESIEVVEEVKKGEGRFDGSQEQI